MLIGLTQLPDKLVFDDFRTHCDNTVGEPFMAPVTQYVFAEMLGISEHFTAGSHEWLPYSVIPTFPKLICKHQFVKWLRQAHKHIIDYGLCLTGLATRKQAIPGLTGYRFFMVTARL